MFVTRILQAEINPAGFSGEHQPVVIDEFLESGVTDIDRADMDVKF